MLPASFIDRLKSIIPEPKFADVLESFSAPRPLTFRVNTLKTKPDDIYVQLKKSNVAFHRIDWLAQAFYLDLDQDKNELLKRFIEEGLVYQQSLSSMLVAKLLDPQKEETLLDMCAAPGSKTSMLAALMENEGRIIALDAVKERFYKLKSVVALLGAECVEPQLMDARRFRSQLKFDRILVDAPCSSEGRFQTKNPKSLGYWSVRKIKEMEHKQRGLLLNASRYLKSGGTLIYSTCTFAPEENEGSVDWLMRKTKGELELQDISLEAIESYPAKEEWLKQTFHPQIHKCVRILPTQLLDAFFIAKFKKV